VAIATVLVAQTPAGGPPRGAFKGAGKGKGPGRAAPQYRLEKGLPIDTRPETKTDDHSLWEGQTRAPYEPSIPYNVKLITDKLQQPWSIAFLPDGKMLVTEKPGNMRTVTQDGVVSEPLKGVPKVHFQGQVGLLDLALDKNFARNRRIFFTYSENVNDTDSHIVLDSATLNPAATEITDVKGSSARCRLSAISVLAPTRAAVLRWIATVTCSSPSATVRLRRRPITVSRTLRPSARFYT
jgi:hypothetical protein